MIKNECPHIHACGYKVYSSRGLTEFRAVGEYGIILFDAELTDGKLITVTKSYYDKSTDRLYRTRRVLDKFEPLVAEMAKALVEEGFIHNYNTR